MGKLPVASWFPKCLAQAVGAIAPGCIPLLAGAGVAVAWPIAAGVACFGAAVWLNRWEGQKQNEEHNKHLQEYFQYLLQTQASTREQILDAIKKHADKLPASLPLDDEATERLVSLTQAVHQLRDKPSVSPDDLAAALQPLLVGHEKTQSYIADALLEARDRFDGVDAALAEISEDLAAAAQSIKDHTTAEHIETRAALKAEIAKLANAQIAQAQTIAQLGATNASLAQQLGSANDQAVEWHSRYEAAIARQVEAERTKGIGWKDTIDSIRALGPAAVLQFLQSQAPDADERAEMAELYAEMVAAAMAAIDYPAAEDAARLWSAHAPHDAVAWNSYGFILHTRSQYPAALTAFREAERIDRAALGDDHPNVARDVNNIGSVLKAQGDLPAALTAYREAERIDRAALGDDHPNVATDVNNIGSVLQDQGDLPAALTAYREAERIDRAALGDNHPNVAIRVNNIGIVLKAQGDLTAALDMYREAERIDRPAFGDNHPNVATDVNNIGSVLQAQGDLTGALAMYREAERIDRAAFGDDHPEVATDVNNIGGVLFSQGKRDEAIACVMQAFEIDLRKLGPRALNTLNRARNLLTCELDPIAEARRIAGEAVAIELQAAFETP